MLLIRTTLFFVCALSLLAQSDNAQSEAAQDISFPQMMKKQQEHTENAERWMKKAQLAVDT